MFLTVSAAATAFTYVTLNVPSGWSATESESGAVVLVNDSNRTDRILIQLGVLGGTTLQTAATVPAMATATAGVLRASVLQLSSVSALCSDSANPDKTYFSISEPPA